MTKSELAHRMMKIVFARVGGSQNLEQARDYIARLSPIDADGIKREAMSA